MDRSKYAFEEINKIEAIQFKSLDENKYEIAEFFKDQGHFQLEFLNHTGEMKIHPLGDFSRIIGPGDYVTLKNGKLEVYERVYFESTYKKV